MRKVMGLAVAAVAALALSGCSGADEGGKTEPSGGEKNTQSAEPTGDASEGATSGSPDGTWAATTDGKAVALVVKGDIASVLGEHACTGKLEDMGGDPMFSLACPDGDRTRTMGTIESNDGKTMVVSWDAGVKDTFKKAESGELPDGIPSEPDIDLPTEQ